MVTTTLALGITILTLLAFTILGIYYSKSRIHSVEDLITARNTTSAGTTTATIIASMMGAWILFSPAEAGAMFGGITAVAGYAIGSALPLIAFIWIGIRVRKLLPTGHSLTEYVYVRFGRLMYGYVLIITISYMFIFLAAEMTGIAGALALIAGVPEWQTAVLIGGFVLVYTAYGGLVASIFTDTLQALLILPILVLGFAGAILALGGTQSMYTSITATNPDLLSPGFRPGLTFGLYVMIAILAANLFNQGIWQRVFAAASDSTVRRSFSIAAVTVIPMIFLPGLFGITAVGLDLIQSPTDGSIAFFLVLLEAFPAWIVFLITLLALLLVMSSADTMLNAIASIVTADMSLITENVNQRQLSITARLVTIGVAAGAIFIGAQGYSVLELFLLADLLAAATVVPFLSGLFSTRITESGAIIASFLGLIIGITYFPITRSFLEMLPSVSGVLPTASFFIAFVSAAGVSSGMTLLAIGMSSSHFDHARLTSEIKSLPDNEPDTPTISTKDKEGSE